MLTDRVDGVSPPDQSTCQTLNALAEGEDVVSQPDDDGRSSEAAGYYWASRITSIGMETVVPALLGFWADSQWNCSPWATLGGMCLGFALMLFELVQLAQKQARSSGKKRPPPPASS